MLDRETIPEKPSRGGEKRTAVWASHPEDRGSDEVIAPPYVTPGWSRIAGECVSGAPPRGQPRMPAMMLPHGCEDRKSTRLNSSHLVISYAVFCLKKKKRQYE